jgi:hypothetical protein
MSCSPHQNGAGSLDAPWGGIAEGEPAARSIIARRPGDAILFGASLRLGRENYNITSASRRADRMVASEVGSWVSKRDCDMGALTEALRESLHGPVLGCTTAGEIGPEGFQQGTSSAWPCGGRSM